MTNIIAIVTVCLVTNIVETDNAPSKYSHGIWPETYFTDHSEATEKVVTTTIKEVTTIKFTWRGKEWIAKDLKTVSEKKECFRKEVKEKWLVVTNPGPRFAEEVITFPPNIYIDPCNISTGGIYYLNLNATGGTNGISDPRLSIDED